MWTTLTTTITYHDYDHDYVPRLRTACVASTTTTTCLFLVATLVLQHGAVQACVRRILVQLEPQVVQSVFAAACCVGL